MSKCGKSFLPECEYFTTGGCISPFNCPYKIEQENIITTTQFNLYASETDKDKGIARLTKENTALQARLEKAVKLKATVGDTVYWIEWKEEIDEDVGTVMIPYIEKGILLKALIKKDEITIFASRDEYWEHACFNEKEYNKTWFTDRTKAEARLAELKR